MTIYKGSMDMNNRVSNAGGVTFDQIFKAIGDPHRLQILMLLLENELSAGEILQALDVVQSTLSHHMKSLVDAGVVTASRHGKWTYYSLNTEILEETVSYLNQFTAGTKVRAQFSEHTAAGSPPQVRMSRAAAPAKPAAKTASVESSKDVKPVKPSKGKTEKDEATVSEAREEKKKSKKGKKGKKNKK